ncbi:hypothetical protein [Brevibacillus laterosporus]|uniref:hypothetical protein n=1 Tax=Brevibacillus laterosporus TaxID=1465 RepID=UPI000E6D4613|nr:hypothetical protein [Brevibacillus laterosporus]AYB37570.1 hypothetical protein D5F52_04350 [Brevibacillus laterosporus]MBM7111730.1 hypothetical protein [Brevibacillus laterosporus]
MDTSIVSEITAIANPINKPIKIFIVNYEYEDLYLWNLISSESEARSIDSEYKLASINDLHAYIEEGGEVFEGIIKVKEGLCKWFEKSTMTEDMLEDYYCEYRLIEKKHMQ